MSDDRTPSPSPEVVAVFGRMMAAFRDKDIDALSNLFSSSPLLRGIGTDADEFWDGERFLEIVEIQLTEIPAWEFSIEHIEAYELGDVAWGVAVAEHTLEDGTRVPMRISAVFCLEGGVWRCVQNHTSVPVSNEEVFGVALTTTLTDLLDSLDADTLASIETKEGMAALMFTDIEGSTALAHEMGDSRWAETIQDHDRFVVDTAEGHGGAVLKTLGDGALITFTAARNAVRCAIALQEGFVEHPFRVRIGIHAGDVMHSGGDVIGATVNKAARVAAAAEGGQVVVSAVTRELAGASDEFTYGAPFRAELKGIPGVHELVPVRAGSPG